MTIRVIAHGNRFASVGRAIVVTIDHDAGTLDLRAPFYRRTIRLTDIAAVSAESDDGMNHGLVNWFVTGKAYSPNGVRLNTGGKARVGDPRLGRLVPAALSKWFVSMRQRRSAARDSGPHGRSGTGLFACRLPCL